MLQNGQTYFKNLAVFNPQDFKVCLTILQHEIKGWLIAFTKCYGILECTEISEHVGRKSDKVETSYT